MRKAGSPLLLRLKRNPQVRGLFRSAGCSAAGAVLLNCASGVLLCVTKHPSAGVCGYQGGRLSLAWSRCPAIRCTVCVRGPSG